MSLHNEASRLTLAEFIDRGGDQPFYWMNSNGTTGPAVQMDYRAVPRDITRMCFAEILRWSPRSVIQLVRLMADDDQEDLVVAKIMNKPLDGQRLHAELNLLREIRHKHVAAVVGSFTAGGQDEPKTGVLIFPLAVQNLDQLLRGISSYNAASNSKAWHPHQNTLQLLQYFACLCRTVQHLHGRRRPVKHRDIKPENILVDRVDNVILADFDISKAYDNAAQAITYGSGDGTVMYSSRDVWSTNDPLSTQRGLEWDIISLGFVFLEMATVVFGRTLEDMRARMRFPHPTSPGEPVVVYSAALEGGQIHTWLEVLRRVPTETPWKLPRRFAELTRFAPNYVDEFLRAIKGMMHAEQNEGDPLERARVVFSQLSENCSYCQ
jgi:serine/threonine protein kinase